MKTKIWSILFLVAMTLQLMVACGGDDNGGSNGGGPSNIVDGVHVNSRKLLSLDFYKNDNSKGKFHYAMSYDSKGRLSKIDATYYYENNGETKSEDYKFLTIDYDLNFIEYFDDKYTYNSTTGKSERKDGRVFFSLNNKGFISTLGNCELSYDNNGYLVGASTVKDMWTFAYSDGDVIKYMVETLKNGNIGIYYTHYGEKEGNMYFSVNYLDKFKNGDYYISYSDCRTACFLIMYHAGLFGNISKRANLIGKNQNAIVEQISDVDNSNMIIHCSAVFDR